MAARPHRETAEPDSAAGVDELVVVRRVRYVRDYVVEFIFTDRSCREIDLEPFLRGPLFEPLRDLEAFRRFKVTFGSIAWPNGADIAPETLYYNLGPVPPEEEARV